MNTFQHAIDKLDFDKIRQRIQRYVSSETGMAIIRSLVPSTSLSIIQVDLARVSEAKRLLEEESGLPLEGIYPVREVVQKSSIEGTVLTAKDLSQIYSTLRASRVLRQFLAKREEQYPELWNLASSFHVDKVLEYNIEQAIDEAGNLRANASRELASLRRAIADKYDQTKKLLESILKNVADLGFSQDEIITTREGRMVIPVKSEHKNRVHGFIHSASASGATVFIEPTETLDLNNEIRTLQFQEQREIERILNALTRQVGQFHAQLVSNLKQLAILDALNAKAKYSIEIIGIEPAISKSGSMKIAQGRHPILLQTHGRDGTVALDLELGKDYTTLIISGPNAGGKSVAMKTVGLLSLMVQSGLHIPASEQSVLRVFNDIFVDIGDEQSIENDLSTFSSHLQNLKSIDANATGESLVLIDEIGSGTDPAEGGALAAAFLETLTERRSFTIATTHHSMLKVFAHDADGVENGAMAFDQDGLTPTYRFKAGVPGSSYALEMAQRLGFREDLLRRSREFMGTQQAKLEHLIGDLEVTAQKHRNDIELLGHEKNRLDELVNRYETKIAAHASEMKELKRAALDEAKQIVEAANALIERSIREIRERSADGESIRQVRSDIKKAQTEAHRQIAALTDTENIVADALLEPGTTVKLVGGEQTGEVATISPDRKTAVVVFGNVKMKVALKNLERTSTKSNVRQMLAAEVVQRDNVIRELDLRGMTGDEAIPMVDKFIDTAMLTGLNRVDIIHGKGTGALRTKIASFLAKHSHVKSQRFGEWNEGGTGVTVVELK